MADVVAGKALWEAGIDRSKIPSDAAAVNAEVAAAGAKGEQAATASATSTLAKVSGLARTAASTVALGAGAMFGVATKLAADGENAMAKYRAETGATQKEAEDALASMNRLAGQNLQSFDDISAAFTAVQTNLGVTGKDAEDATNQILKFSTATGTDAVHNVGKFDDVLDSWGKTAADLPGIMDLIVASNQKFGGSVDDTTAALAAGAPVVKAYGGDINDTMDIINLAKASGVEATDVFKGFQAAIRKMPAGTTLDDLVKKLAAVTNDGDRSRLAIEMFGKSGAKLANAIHPGITGLQDFATTATDTADATSKAASAIESTLPNQIHTAVQGALAQARGFATDFGPALMGASSFASIGTSIATALKLDTALAKAWGGVASSPAYLAAARAAGAAGGTAAGAAATAATVLAPIALFATLVITLTEVLPVKEAQGAIDKAAGGRDMRSFWEKLLGINGPQRLPWETGLEAGKQAADGAQQGLVSAPFNVNPMTDAEKLAAYYQLVQENALKAAHGPRRGTFMDLPIPDDPTADGRKLAAYYQLVQDNAIAAAHGPHRGAFFDLGQEDANVMLKGWFAGDFNAGGVAAGNDLGQGLAEGLKQMKGEVSGGMAELKDALEHPLRGIHTVAKVEGALTSKELADGLKSNDPYTRQVATQTRDGLIAKLHALQDAGYNIGKKGMALLAQGITDGTGPANVDAQNAHNIVVGTLGSKTGFYGGGFGVGSAWANGLAAAISAGIGRAEDALHGYHGPMIGQSPPKTGPLREIDKGGYNIGRAWALGLARGAGSLAAGGFLGGYGPLQQLASAGAKVRHEHSGTVTVRLSGETIAAARGQGASWDDIGRMARSANGLVAGLQMRLGTNG